MLISHAMYTSCCLFFIGLLGIIIKKNLFFILISIEIMINSLGFFLVISSNHWKHIDGQIAYIILLTTTTVEISIFLSIFLIIFSEYNTLNINSIK